MSKQKHFPLLLGRRQSTQTWPFGLSCSGHSLPVNSDLKAHTPCCFYSGHISLCMGFSAGWCLDVEGPSLTYVVNLLMNQVWETLRWLYFPPPTRRHALGPGLPPEPSSSRAAPSLFHHSAVTPSNLLGTFSAGMSPEISKSVWELCKATR